MIEPCETVIGQDPAGQPVVCGKAGVRMGEVVKCSSHWTQSRARAGRVRVRVREES